ncbi:MAG: helix-turn-helix transcriptional regulator [candidate division Zixibacteria bacterium]|nr:helix-turn-helix transcriptional regulator [Candidatus Tariuqbacter arcticus]
MNHGIDIPRLVRELRRRTGLSQVKFAAKLGVSFPTINRWENGHARPSSLAMLRIEELVRSMGNNGDDLLKQYFPEGL